MAPNVTAIDVRPAQSSDAGTLADILGSSFHADPVMTWIFRGPSREQSMRGAFEVVASAFVPHDQTYVTADGTAAALWTPPGAELVGPDDEESFGERLYAAAGEDNASRAFQVLEVMAQHHPAEPAFYLGLIGVVPKLQGRGIGTRLMSNVLARCDAEGIPAYLEASSEVNRRLYERNGFVCTGDVPIPDGPTMYAMWRDPQPRR